MFEDKKKEKRKKYGLFVTLNELGKVYDGGVGPNKSRNGLSQNRSERAMKRIMNVEMGRITQ